MSTIDSLSVAACGNPSATSAIQRSFPNSSARLRYSAAVAALSTRVVGVAPSQSDWSCSSASARSRARFSAAALLRFAVFVSIRLSIWERLAWMESLAIRSSQSRSRSSWSPCRAYCSWAARYSSV